MSAGRRPDGGASAERDPVLRTWISAEPLDPGGLLDDLGDERDGGVALFVGRVRAWNGGRRVTRLTYEAYVEMAEEELARIAAEVAGRAAVGAVAAVHRVGELAPGEPSVAVAVAAPHRAAAYEASRAVIEAIKVRLPIWKRESYADGTERWLGAAGARRTPAGDGGGAGAPTAEVRTGSG